MHPARLLTVVALAAALLTNASATQARGGARGASCAARHSKTILQDPAARVYRVPGFVAAAQVDGGLIFGCLRATGRRVKVGERYSDNYVLWGTVDHLRLAGTTVASLQSSTDVSCKAACPPDYNPTSKWVQVNDLATRRSKQDGVQGTLLTKDLLLTRAGVVAWLDGAKGAARLNTLTTRGARVVDQGNIDAASVTISGSMLSWTKDGQAHSVSIAPGAGAATARTASCPTSAACA